MNVHRNVSTEGSTTAWRNAVGTTGISAPQPVVSFTPVVLSAPARGEDMAVRVSIPATGHDLPIMLFSHGNGQSLYGYGPLVDFWAAHGFVVIQPTHLDSRTLRLAPDDPRRPLLWRSRVEDLKRVLDQLDAIEETVPALIGRLDRSRIAVAGHSWGAQTASMLLGARHPHPEDGSVVDMADDRVKAGVLFAVPGLGGDDLSPFAAAHFPFMHPDFSSMSTPTLDDTTIANGEIGIVALANDNGWFNVTFARRSNFTFGYSKRDFPDGAGPLELAYALTVHKAQGSEFSTVFVVLPQHTALLSRELIYTALTRSRTRLVLLIEGTNTSFLYDLTKGDASETIRRNTNLFHGSVREEPNQPPYAEKLIHRAEKGHMVRSKSELVISNILYSMDIEYHYERPFEGQITSAKKRPDFSFIDPAGNIILWEYLGMLDFTSYRQGWEAKRTWYEQNGYQVGINLFITEEDERGALDSQQIKALAQRIQALL
jgi:pimeloyl-ACP methyl ester carboxylesterase